MPRLVVSLLGSSVAWLALVGPRKSFDEQWHRRASASNAAPSPPAAAAPLEYWSPTWVTSALSAADVPARDASEVQQLEPGFGIPGRRFGQMEAFRDEQRLTGAHDALLARARALRPPASWWHLARFHHEMLGKKSLPAYRVRDALAWGLAPNSTLIDAGCGWGRLAVEYMALLERGRYHGLDADEFSMRAFVQVELGIERGALAREKAPTLLLSRFFEFARLLDGGGARGAGGRGARRTRADTIVFSSVLKNRMPDALRLTALHRARCALREQRGLVLVFVDCHDRVGGGKLRRMATHAGLELVTELPRGLAEAGTRWRSSELGQQNTSNCAFRPSREPPRHPCSDVEGAAFEPFAIRLAEKWQLQRARLKDRLTEPALLTAQISQLLEWRGGRE